MPGVELNRKLSNLAGYGYVVETKTSNGSNYARVDINGRKTDWLKVHQISNSLIKIWMPIQRGEQVLVLSPDGDASSGSIIPIGEGDIGGASSDNVIAEIADTRFEISGADVHLKANLILDGDFTHKGDYKTSGKITDSRGSLTDFQTTDGAKRA